MNSLEDRLRDAFRADADTVRPGTIPPVPGRPVGLAGAERGKRGARILIPVAAAAAVLALVTGLSLATSRFGTRVRSVPISPVSSPPASGAWPSGPVHTPVLRAQASRGVPASAAAPGLPRFYVTVYNAADGGMNHIFVRGTASGRAVATITSPAGHFFAGMAATAGDRTFLTALESNTGCTAQLEWFRLDDHGRPGPLTPLHITVPRTYGRTGDLAITPDGRTIAYAAYECDGAGEVGVIHLASRHARVWSDPLPNSPASLSLSADGRWLGYTMGPGGARVLSTGAPAGSLAARSRIVPGGAPWAVLASGGQALYECTVSSNGSGRQPSAGTLTYGTAPLAAGPERVIARWHAVPDPQCYASLDPAGRYLLVQYPTVAHAAPYWSRPAILDLRTGRLTFINAPAFYGPLDVAW
jgi:hypothetical protein